MRSTDFSFFKFATEPNLVSIGKGIALLPTYLESEGYLSIDDNTFLINYYSYRYS